MPTAKLYVCNGVADEIHDHVKRELAGKWGGYTATHAEGGWLNDDGELVEESVTVYEVVVNSTTDGGALYSHIVGLTRHVRDESDEKEVVAHVDGNSGEKITVRSSDY